MDEEERDPADRIGYPVVVRPSYVRGGRAMEIVTTAESSFRGPPRPRTRTDQPVLIDRFSEGARGSTFGTPSRGTEVLVGGRVMEHIEAAGDALRRFLVADPAAT